MKRKHLMMTDGGWETFKQHMTENTQEALDSGAYPFAVKAKNPEFVVVQPIDPLSCPTYCPECKGLNYKVDGNGEVWECPNYRARLDRKNRVVSEPENPPDDNRIDFPENTQMDTTPS